MNWFEGSIEDAINVAKRKNCIFAVYVEGNNKLSKTMTSVMNSYEISTILESNKFVSIKIQSDSKEYNYFVKIYKHVPVPSLFLIGVNGVPVAVIHNLLDKDRRTIQDQVLKTLSSKKNLICQKDIFGPEANTSKIVPFEKFDEITTSNIGNQETVKSLPLKQYKKSIDDDIFISTTEAVFKNTSNIISGEKSHDGFNATQQDGYENSKEDLLESVATLNTKDIKNFAIEKESAIETLSTKLADEQDSKKQIRCSLTYSVLKVIGMDESSEGTLDSSSKNKDNEDAPSFSTKDSEEIANEDMSTSGITTESKSICADDSVVEVEQLDITDELTITDSQEVKSENSAEEHPAELRRRPSRRSSTEHKTQEANEYAQEKIQNYLDRQRILKEIELDKEERLARQRDVINFQRNISNEPTLRSPNSEQPRVNSTDHTLIQFRTPNGSTVTKVFHINTVIKDLRQYVTHNIQLGSRRFDLAVAFPSHTFTTEEDVKTLEELHLVPNAVILILPVISNSTALFRRVSDMFWYLVSPMVTFLLYIRENVFRPLSESLRVFFSLSLLSFALPQLSANSPQSPRGAGNTQFSETHRNIRVITDLKNNDDDENNTWNGNSTQQSQ